MRLLRIIPSIDPRDGGPIEGARRIDTALKTRGISVEVACLEAPDNDEFLRTYPAPVHALGPSSLGYRYSSRLLPWLKNNCSRFDAVIVNGLWQYHGFAAWRALKSTNTPYFVFTHGMLDPWFKHAYPLKHLKKWLYWLPVEYRLLRDAKAVLFTSDEERRLARESFWLYRANETVTSYGTESPPADPTGELATRFISKHPELAGKRILLFLSRIHEKKGCDLLLEAFARVMSSWPDLHLVMAGPDQTEWTEELKEQAEALGIARHITWPGMLQDEDKWGAFHSAEVFCLPSHQENFGIVVAEALGCGKPVLISNKVNIWREVEVDSAGIVRNDTLEGTIDALRTWLQMSDVERVAMQNSAQSSFDSRYRIEQVADSLLNIIQSNIEAKEGNC